MKNFKDKYFVINPLTPAAYMTLFDTMEYQEGGERKSGLACKFCLEWKYEHFERGTNNYIYRRRN